METDTQSAYPDLKASSRHPPSSIKYSGRVASALRLGYQGESLAIQKQWGDLETIRHRLDLSQRQMCRLLLVDPSAWTRWTKAEATVPPHIYRMLEWYLMLKEKTPAIGYLFEKTNSQAAKAQVGMTERLESQVFELSVELSGLKQQLKSQQSYFLKISCAVFIGLALVLAVGLFR